ncbi:MAG: antitoxin component of MazEF toxin-antitoxin module [Rhodothermales bacterium]|jgi:antitoxin component of MazEF toxin-antitoxin module
MSQKTTVKQIGGSLAFIVPKPIAEALALRAGDELFVSNDADSITITPYDPEFAEAMEDGRAFMRSHRNAFRELAK